MGAAEELFDFADIRGAGVGGETFDKDPAILFLEDAIVHEREQATVVEGADEASEALLEGDDGGGDRVIEERVAAVFVDGAATGLDDWVTGNGEGNFVDDDRA